ncbi:hypothetical protein LBMAG42_26820 [Deltaproteobacteria bacterium]|nr:hypothetical protein LBMAG42_26820 [Deltaproteobacteria bacterium]
MLLLLQLSCAEPLTCPVGFVVAIDTGGEDVCAFDEPSILDLVRTFDEGALVKVNTEPYMPPSEGLWGVPEFAK